MRWELSIGNVTNNRIRFYGCALKKSLEYFKTLSIWYAKFGFIDDDPAGIGYCATACTELTRQPMKLSRHFSLSGVMWINNGWDGQRWVHFKCALRLGTWISYDKVCSEKLFADGQNWGNNEQTLDFVRSPTTCWYYVGWFCWVNVAICTVSRTSDESALSSGSFSTSNKFWAAITRRHNLHPTTLKTLGHSKLFSGGQRHLSTYSGSLVE